MNNNPRLDKLNLLKQQGINPYPARYVRSHNTLECIDLFKKIEKENPDVEHNRTTKISTAGRIMAIRKMGNASFIDIQDGFGKLQTLLRKNVLNEKYNILETLDIGDWAGISGEMFKTRTGEITCECSEISLLSKSMHTLPEKWHGLTDTETRYRQRYLDLISNEDSKKIAVTRSKTVTAIRRYMEHNGFLEVETPVLVPVAAGAMAKPFVTHHNSLNRDLYLRIATELYLKKLIVGGLDKVFEIGRVFRNEGIDYYHNPEFTMMESYSAFTDYQEMMTMVENLISTVAMEILGSYQIDFGKHKIDFTPPWKKLNLPEEIFKQTKIDILNHSNIDSLKNEMLSKNLEIGNQTTFGGLIDKLLSDSVEPKLIQPSFLVDYPIEMSPLAKKKEDNPKIVERFEGFVAGMEICNAFSELNDPIDQRERFEEQESMRINFNDEEADRLDEDFLQAIEYGMPPTGGLGLGIDRLVMLLTNQKSIREVVLFPQLRS